MYCTEFVYYLIHEEEVRTKHSTQTCICFHWIDWVDWIEWIEEEKKPKTQ